MEYSYPDERQLPDGDFRARRTCLADHLFALLDGPSPTPTDLVPREAWAGMTHLPTDVLLRTTDYQGGVVDATYQQLKAWVFAMPLPDNGSIFAADVTFDAGDEFEAALSSRRTGGTGRLRGALVRRSR